MPSEIFALIAGAYQGFGGGAPPPPPSPDPEPAASEFVFGMSTARIQALPRTGAAWNNVVTLADQVYNIQYSEAQGGGGGGAIDGSSSAFCGGLVWVATGNTAYRDKVNAALDELEFSIGLNPPLEWHHAAFNRKLGGWAMAGQLVGRAVRNTNGSLTSWGRFLSDMRFKIGTGPARANPMHNCAFDWSNNHGAAARASLAAITAILGELTSQNAPNGYPIGLADQWKWFKAFCGDKSDYGCHPTATRTYGGLGKTDPTFSNSWMVHTTDWAPINQSTALFGSNVPLYLDGCLNSEAFRDGTTFSLDANGRPVMGASGDQYSFGALSSATMNAVIFAAAGYTQVWQTGDHALRRARSFLSRWNYNKTGEQHEPQDPILRKVYLRPGFTFPGSGSFTTSTPGRSYLMSGTDWLALDAQWPPAPVGWYSS